MAASTDAAHFSVDSFIPVLPPAKTVQKVMAMIWNSGGKPVDLGVIFNHMRDIVTQGRKFNKESGKGFTDTQFRLNAKHDCLLMKKEDIWVIPPPRDLVSFPTLYELGDTVINAEAICRHRTWATEFPFLVMRLMKDGRELPFFFPLSFSTLSVTADSLGGPLHCAMTHVIGCRCQHNAYWGEVKSCPNCFTDYALSIVAIPGTSSGERGLVFTSWKNLGGGHPPDFEEDPYWDSHVDETDAIWRPRCPPVYPYLDYEAHKINQLVSTTGLYNPEISVGYGIMTAAEENSLVDYGDNTEDEDNIL